MKSEYDGSISVLMAVVFLLVVSLVLVGLESARQQNAVGMVGLSLQNSAESVLGAYYAPLFDEYGLYGLYEVDIREELARYAEAAAQPTADVPSGYSGEKSSCYSYAYEIADIALTRSVGLLEGGPSICRNQMIEAGAVSGVQELAEMLLRAVKLLRDSESSVEALEYQQRIERELSKTDTKLLELMKWLDGVPTDKSGVKLQPDGSIVPEPVFVKRVVDGAVTAGAVHMNNETFFQCLQNRYVDVRQQVEEIRAAVFADGSEKDWEALRMAHARAYGAVLDALKPTDEAISLLGDLIRLQETYRPLILEFEEYLDTVAPLLEDEFVETMHEGLKTMKKYIGEGENGKVYHFREMRDTLLSNREILRAVSEKMRDVPIKLLDWKIMYGSLPEMFDGYRLDYLEIDYSTVKKSSLETFSLWKTVKDVITNGIVGGVYGDDISLSDDSLFWVTGKPSSSAYGSIESLYAIPGLSTEGDLDAEFLSGVLDGNLFGRLLDRLADGVVALSEKILLISYLTTHMSDYSDADAAGVLKYEQEYLLYGNTKDSQNQKSATKSILGLRVIMNLVHVFSDAAKKAEALVVATEILSVMPLPVLIKIAQYLILVVWAIQNAYLETAEIIRGRSVPVLVTSGSFQLSLSDAFTMTKSKRIAAAQAYKSPGGLCLGYSHYLMLLMLFTDSDTLTMRGLDIIQINLQAKYDYQFRLRDCVYGFEATMTVLCPSLYTDIAPGTLLPERGSAYEITEKCAVSY